MSNYDTVLKYKPQIQAILADYGAANLRIFGSSARRNDTDGSDIDVIVDIIKPTGSRLLTRAGLSVELSELFTKPVDIVIGDDAFVKKINPKEILAIC